MTPLGFLRTDSIRKATSCFKCSAGVILRRGENHAEKLTRLMDHQLDHHIEKVTDLDSFLGSVVRANRKRRILPAGNRRVRE